MTWRNHAATSFIAALATAALTHAACGEDTRSTGGTAVSGPGPTTSTNSTSTGTSSSTSSSTGEGAGGTQAGGNAGEGGTPQGGTSQGGISQGGTSQGGLGMGGGTILGCLANPSICPPNWMCCGGVPYDPSGECHPMCTMQSDRTTKHGIEHVDGDAILEKLAAMPISEWRYDADPGVVHMGPMAQDFHAAFGLGDSDRRITTVDANGVAFAAIQALTRRVEALEAALQKCQGTATPLPSTSR